MNLDADGRRYLDIVREQADRMGKLIDDLLQLSRVAQGDIYRQPADLTEIALAAVARLQHASPDPAAEILVAPNLVARADRRLLALALENLLGNSLKFTKNSPIPQIQVGATLNGSGETVYYVSDNGAGFDMTQTDRLFTAFQRLHREAEFEGTGIGLATVQRIVRRHGGRVWAQGKVGEGATFYFTLEPKSTTTGA